jgi:hypothetical protein
VRPERIGKLKKFIHLIGSQTHDLSLILHNTVIPPMKDSTVGRRASKVVEPVAYLVFVYVICTAIAIWTPVIAYVSWAAALHNVCHCGCASTALSRILHLQLRTTSSAFCRLLRGAMCVTCVGEIQVGRQVLAGGSLLCSGHTKVCEPKIGEMRSDIILPR